MAANGQRGAAEPASHMIATNSTDAQSAIPIMVNCSSARVRCDGRRLSLAARRSSSVIIMAMRSYHGGSGKARACPAALTTSRSVSWAAFFMRRSTADRDGRSCSPKCGTVYRGVPVADAHLRTFIDRLSFPTRVGAVTIVAVFTVALLFDFEIPSWEISRLLTWND
jgi:hypothetical protein